MENFYQLFEINTDASKEEIKSAYNRLMRIHHPDRNADSPSSNFATRLLNNAYSVLMDDVKRGQYDVEHGIVPRKSEVRLVEKTVYRDRMIAAPADDSEKWLWGLFGAAGAALLVSAFMSED